MTINSHENFEEIEIEHDFRTYYASGCVEYSITECIGTNYEGYDFETVYEREITDITINDLWYNDKETGDSVEISDAYNYRDIEKMAEEAVRYKYE